MSDYNRGYCAAVEALVEPQDKIIKELRDKLAALEADAALGRAARKCLIVLEEAAKMDWPAYLWAQHLVMSNALAALSLAAQEGDGR